MTSVLYHVHDPMCSWCWGFKPTWIAIKKALPSSVAVQNILGGLAPDTNDPMPASMQQMLQQTWQRISETIPGTQFNHDFWIQNQPRRATYPACRAVIAARAQNPEFEEPMILAIQTAYYLNAANPSDDHVLETLGASIGCDETRFKHDLNSNITSETLNKEIYYARQIGVHGFPSLLLSQNNGNPEPIAINYTDSQAVVEQIDIMLAS